MGKTSSAVKDRYNAKAYDTITIRVKKGMKKMISEHALKKGCSLNGYIVKLIDNDMEADGE